MTGTPTQRRQNHGAASLDRLYVFGGDTGTGLVGTPAIPTTFLGGIRERTLLFAEVPMTLASSMIAA
ncbi:MAG: hypothetical protein RL148_1122 [Planctomycetota bacterium]